MKLYYQIYPEQVQLADLGGAVPLIIIPGLFGSTTNWRSLGRQFGQNRPTIVLDQRNHGGSQHADSHSYNDMVQDLQEFCAKHQLQKIILCGHSMGGKVAMLFALAYPDMVEKLVVLDIAPVQYHHSHAPFLEELMKVDLSHLQSRSAADRALVNAIPDTATRLFLLQSLRGSPGGYQWRLNLSVLHKYMAQIVDFPQVEKQVPNPALFVAGALSDYLQEKHHTKIAELFSSAQFASIPEAGHWLHAERPAQVLKTVQDFIET